MNKILEELKNESWYQRLASIDNFGEDLQGDCNFFIEKLILELQNEKENKKNDIK